MVERGQDARLSSHPEDEPISLADEMPERLKYTAILKRRKNRRQSDSTGKACLGEAPNHAKRR
jgi:hypothetical protein